MQSSLAYGVSFLEKQSVQLVKTMTTWVDPGCWQSKHSVKGGPADKAGVEWSIGDLAKADRQGLTESLE